MLLLIATLCACSYATVERDAPELGKRYLLTEDLVLTRAPRSPGSAPA